ncbi:MAG: aldo/keto reductase [Selenomonadaceae bacterium]|nr:aldo/keto reductase [Selenomonadaceae bacterium]
MTRREFLTLITCAAFANVFSACGAQNLSEKTKEVHDMSKSFFSDSVALNSGFNMPRIGLGTWTLTGAVAEECVYHALKVGYRLIDTARYYRNEIDVGNGIRRAIGDGIATREEIFVTTKILPDNHNSPDTAIDDSLRKFGFDYIDLVLIHQPGRWDEETYHALERGVNAGKIRSIGISNYYTPEDFDRIRNIARIVPAVVQNENHPFYQNRELQDYLKHFSTVVESWYPFGGRGNTQKIFGNDTIQQLAEKYSKSPAQIVLRWHIQENYIVIPGSSNKAHIEENFNVFDFRLSEKDMNLIRAVNQNRRFENW